MTSCFFLRVDLSQKESNADISVSDVLVLLDQDQWCWCVENDNGPNPHIHICFTTLTKMEVLRQRLRALGLRGNKSYSLKTCDSYFPVEVIAYILKDGKYSTNLPQSEIDLALSADAKIKASIKAKKDARKSIYAKLKESLQPGEDYHHIEFKVMKYHIDNELVIRRFQVQALIDTLWFSEYANNPDKVEDLKYSVAKYFEKR